MMPGDAEERRGGHVVAGDCDAVLPSRERTACAKSALEPVFRRAAQHVIPSVIAMKPRNITSDGDINAALPCTGRRWHAPSRRSGSRRARRDRDDPGHEELRQREQVRDVDDAENLRRHQARRVTDEHRQREVVDDEEYGGGNDEPAFRREQRLEVREGRQSVPIGDGDVLVGRELVSGLVGSTAQRRCLRCMTFWHGAQGSPNGYAASTRESTWARLAPGAL